ncbi:uncharacterized protein LOC131650382 [Vicia villosa]|uniref:uncharacterized protein LOC131650382 n=1 Tax=Vicia villosa TaxID=3911 RepID=UPI00273C2EDD|nr:uncharacterized protein LOC131650382 [Vicia villosa]
MGEKVTLKKNRYGSNPIGEIIDHAETTLEEPHVEAHVDPLVEPNVETIFSEDLREENPKNEEHEVQGEWNVEAGVDDDIPIAHIMKSIIENVTKSEDKDTHEKAKKMVDVNEETETNEELVVTMLKSIAWTPVNKKRKVQEKITEKKSLKRKLAQSSDSETYAKEDVHDIASTIRRKVGGKRILMSVVVAPVDNRLFHCEINVQKWKYVFLRRISYERELGTDALDCKEIMDLLKAFGLMKTIADFGPCYEKLFKEIITTITSECNLEGSSDYNKVYVRGKCMIFSPSIINDFLGRSKSAKT